MIEIDKVEKKKDLKNGMAGSMKKINAKKSNERVKEQQKDEGKNPHEIKIKSKLETKKSQEIKVQPKDETDNNQKIKIQPTDERKKSLENHVQPIKSLKEPADIERIKNSISRNVALNRSFNTNSKLELLR